MHKKYIKSPFLNIFQEILVWSISERNGPMIKPAGGFAHLLRGTKPPEDFIIGLLLVEIDHQISGQGKWRIYRKKHSGNWLGILFSILRFFRKFEPGISRRGMVQ